MAVGKKLAYYISDVSIDLVEQAKVALTSKACGYRGPRAAGRGQLWPF